MVVSFNKRSIRRSWSEGIGVGSLSLEELKGGLSLEEVRGGLSLEEARGVGPDGGVLKVA